MFEAFCTDKWSLLYAALYVWLSAGRYNSSLLLRSAHCGYESLTILLFCLCFGWTTCKNWNNMVIMLAPWCLPSIVFLNECYSRWQIEAGCSETTQQSTLQPVALFTVAVSLHAARCTLYTHHHPLPIEVNTDVILSLYHWSVAPPVGCQACLISQG